MVFIASDGRMSTLTKSSAKFFQSTDRSCSATPGQPTAAVGITNRDRSCRPRLTCTLRSRWNSKAAVTCPAAREPRLTAAIPIDDPYCSCKLTGCCERPPADGSVCHDCHCVLYVTLPSTHGREDGEDAEVLHREHHHRCVCAPSQRRGQRPTTDDRRQQFSAVTDRRRTTAV